MVYAFKKTFHSYSYLSLTLLFLAAFFMRAFVFYAYVQHDERYRQPDTLDYHNSTICMYIGKGMSRPDNGQPIFWRTPGYSAYLLPFYWWQKPLYGTFDANKSAIKTALWVQIFLSSFTPILLFFLALLLTGSIGLSWIVGCIFAIHPGFVLASCFMLTEALSVLFFFLFLIFLYRGYRFVGEGIDTQTYVDLIIAALMLGIYTWMRPMGQFVAVIALLLLALSSLPWKKKLAHLLVFAFFFVGSISPWIMRNYQLTGHAFFWPGSGTYLACFNVPKLKRHISGRTLKECWQETMQDMHNAIHKEVVEKKKENAGLFVSPEMISGKHMWPWMYKYPLWALQDWMQEVCKTTFDLYSYQLVAFSAGTWKADPLEEFLTEKIAACLYAQPMHPCMRAICWLEFFWSFVMWIGLLLGFFFFIGQALLYTLQLPDFQRKMFFLWLKTGLLIGAVLGMTGGFGYARLRMPVEPLMVILALTFWYWVFYKRGDAR